MLVDFSLLVTADEAANVKLVAVALSRTICETLLTMGGAYDMLLTSDTAEVATGMRRAREGDPGLSEPANCASPLPNW